MLKLSVCLQVNGKTVFWKCWKLFLKNFILLNSKLGDGQDDFSGLVSSFKLPHNVSQLYAGRDFNHWTFYEELNFKYSSFLSYEDRNPCLRIGDVMRSVFIFSSFSLIYGAKLRKTFIHCTFCSCFYYFFREE